MANHQDDELQDVPPGKAGSAALYVVCLVVFLAGFYAMALGFETGSPWLFTGGLLASSASFFVPLQMLARPS
ncbi:hypothetical protein [Cellulomonas sp. ATA003]|uniref:hypothetical protein n=1 Tax=Cellulomonas sp. ATA003 TaxID=3073064 RepID=UPI002872D4F5|nr:hypothetical protein [Cellulomonas sp. ATA003]WNB84396.1 hypothetical protein REH70_10990 [Cellulomonas sp. ATA003]